MSVHPLSVSYHDNVDTEQRIIVDCLSGETLRIALGWDMCIFIGRERLTELRDKITAFLQGSPPGATPQAEKELAGKRLEAGEPQTGAGNVG